MKNVFKFGAIALGAVLLAASCEMKVDIAEVPVSPKMITVSCTLPDSGPDSKVTLTNDGSVGKTAWVNGDEVFFHGKKVGTGYSYTAAAHDVSGDGKTAYFTIPDLSEKYDGGENYNSSLFAVYPASAVATYSEGTKWYYISAFKETNHLLLAGCNDMVNDEYSFKFFNLTGALSFKVDGSSFGGFDQYVIEGNNGETIGWDNLAVAFAVLKSDGVSIEKRYNYTGGTAPGPTSGAITSIAVTPAAGWDNGTTVNTVFFPSTGDAYAPDGANFTSGFTIKFYKSGDEVKRLRTSSSIHVAVGKYLDLGDITSHLFTYVPPATHNSAIGCPADNSTYDLSKTASANCYIVNGGDASNAEKVFKFKAYRGKSTTNVGAIASVSVLWETWNTASVSANSVIAAVDYDKQSANDYYEICFKMPETLHAGNAVIAAKNGLGQILWSWHIWVPSSAVTDADCGLGDGYSWMDRNLGALTVTEAADSDVDPLSFGLFYNWGRKDPFPGLLGLSGYTPITTTGSFIMNGSQMSVSDSYAAPTTYVSTGSDAITTWTPDAQPALWGASKTVNDPCPPGYVVPQFVNGKGVWKGTSATGFEYNSTYKWFKMGSDPYVVFPLIGYIDGAYNPAKIVNNGKRIYIWSSTATPDDVTAYGLRVNSDGSSSNEYHRPQRGSTVRCVAE